MKKLLFIIICITVITVLYSCAPSYPGEIEVHDVTVPKSTVKTDTEIPETVPVTDKVNSTETAPAAAPGEETEQLPKDDTFLPYYGGERYARSLLPESDKKIYDGILDAALGYEPEIELPEGCRALYLYHCVYFDSAELFYLSEDPQINDNKIVFEYLFDKETSKKLSKELDSAYSAFAQTEIKEGDSLYERIFKIYTYLINDTKYDQKADDSYEAGISNDDVNRASCAVGPLLDKESICIGYARATQYLAQRCGIEIFTVKGYANNGVHYFNTVKLDNEYYFVDTTWGDPVGADKNKNYLTYNYLCITTGEILKDHGIDSDIEVPLCTAIKYNYYVQAGLYAENKEDAAEIAVREYEKGNKDILIKLDVNKSDEIYGDFSAGYLYAVLDEKGVPARYRIGYSETHNVIRVVFY